MKRILGVLSLMLFFSLLACDSNNVDIAANIQSTTPAEVAITPEVDTREAESCSPVLNAKVSTEKPLQYAEITASHIQDITLVTRQPMNSGWTHTYYNQSIEFEGLRLELLSYSLNGDTPALSLRCTLPAHLDAETNDWLRREGLRLCFELDGRQVDAFRQRKIGPLTEEGSFEITYDQCILTENQIASANVFNIRPYVECFDMIWGSDVVSSPAGKTYESFRLSEGETYSGVYQGEMTSKNREYITNLSFTRIFLDACTLSIQLSDMPQQTRTPILEDVSVKEILWEENKANGVYEENAQQPEKSKMYLLNKDFSEVQFALDQFHLWQDEMKIAFCLRFPESWTDVECQSIVRDMGLDFAFVIDGEMQKTGMEESAPQFFGQRGQRLGGSIDQLEKYVCDENYQTVTHREQYYVNWFSNLSIDQWKTKSNLTIIPYFTRYSEVDGKTLSQTPIVTESFQGVYEIVFLYDLAISIDITQDLFQDGF